MTELNNGSTRIGAMDTGRRGDVNEASYGLAPTISNPLNPRNLANVQPLHAINKTSGRVSAASTRMDEQAAPNHEKLPLHLRLASSRGRLLEARTAQLPCFMMAQHSPNTDFVGRTDMFPLIDKYLLAETASESNNADSTRLYALCGMGGIGKTDLAVEYAYSRKNKFSAVFWLDSDGVSQLATDFGRISIELGLETPEEAQDLETSIEIVKAWLTRPHEQDEPADDSPEKKPWLLIFDNADNLDVITDYVPLTGNGSILVTSRDPAAKTRFFAHGSGVDLAPLQSAEAVDLLWKMVQRSSQGLSQDEKSASRAIANEFDGLPLAMIQTAGYIRWRQLSMREFVDQYRPDAQYKAVHGVGSHSLSRRYGHTLATAFNFQGLSRNATKLCN